VASDGTANGIGDAASWNEYENIQLFDSNLIMSSFQLMISQKKHVKRMYKP
jgi:hypothetical protein